MNFPLARTWAPLALTAILILTGGGRTGAAAPDAALDRSPVDVVLSLDETWLATANQTSDSVSLVRTSDGKILGEISIGRRPVDIALHPDGRHLLVTSSYGGKLHVLEVAADSLKLKAELELGFQPYGLALTRDGSTAYVAQADADRIAIVKLDPLAVEGHIPVGRWPRYLALSSDERRLAVGTSGDRGITLVDVAGREVLNTEKFVGLNIGHLQLSPDGDSVYYPWMIYRRNPITAANIRLGWVLASRVGRIRFDGSPTREGLSLDPQGRAVADPHGIGITSNQERLVVSAAGTHELLLFRLEDLPFREIGSTDHIDGRLLRDKDRFDRIELGGRPMGLQIARDDQHVFVANYLDNSVQVVNLADRQVTRRIALGGADEPSLVRRGEAIFYDARRSLDQWYSCHSCHYEGGLNSIAIDTMNDGTTMTFKSVLPLQNLAQTAPWTWHGWQVDFAAAMRHSLTTSMLGPEPTDDDVEALSAFLQSLPAPPNPYVLETGTLSDAALRGKALFESDRAACAQCHSGPHFTDGQVHDVGSGGSSDKYQGYNTPSLVGVFRKVHLFHDGRGESLEHLLRGAHAPQHVQGEELSEAELQDLIAYLRTL